MTTTQRSQPDSCVMTASQSGVLPVELYQRLATEAWGIKPIVLEQAFSELLLSEDVLFEALRHATEAMHGGLPVGFTFWRGSQELAEFREWLPMPNDGCLQGYIERVCGQLDGDFTLLLANPHLFHDSVWRAARSFVRGLFPHTGVPCGGVDTGLFIGRYRRTPFGVHRGQMSVITFPTLGDKRFRLWPCGYGEEHEDIQDSLHYELHCEASVEQIARPGDVLYWPADFWHIAEGTGEPTAAWNIGLWWDRPPIFRMLAQLGQFLGDGDELEGGTLPLDANEARLQLQKAQQRLGMVVQSPLLQQAVEIEWRQFLSGDAFRDVPSLLPPDVARLPASGAVSLSPSSQLDWIATDASQLVIVVNGWMWSVARTGDVERFLAGLIAGDSFQAEALLRSPKERRDVLDVLTFLVACRAVQL